MLCDSLDVTEFGGEWIQVYAWLSHSAGHLKLSQYCSLTILQYKVKKLKVNTSKQSVKAKEDRICPGS